MKGLSMQSESLFYYRDKYFFKNSICIMTDSLIKAFGVDITKQRIDSTLIQSNMRKLGRIGIFASTIKKFLKKLKRKHPDLFDTLIESEFADRYLARESEGCFSRVKPSEAGKTFQKLAEDLLYLVELFSSYEKVRTLSEYKLYYPLP